MKKRIIALVLLFVMLLPVSLASCNKETEVEETAIKVYTLYTICEEPTTEEAIREVELALNRIIVYRLGIGLKLYMVTADEYDRLIEDKFQEIVDYQEEQKRLKEEQKNNKNNSSVASDDTSVEPEEIITGDKFIDMLAAGEEYTLPAPRLDIFLVRGFDRYIDLIDDGLLAELDEKLSSEAKLIKDKLYPTFLNAAKVINSKGKAKTYGVPMNTVIGEYEYVVFDEELLNKYEIDAMTMNTLEDLEYYLRIIKENEPDVVPLANAFDSTECTYIFGDGFPALVKDDGVVVDPYQYDMSLDYYTYISRYRSLGYLGDNDDSKRFAVKFVRGTFEDLEALEKKTGHSYVSAIHSYPVATNENTLQNLFCVSKYVVSNELTDVAKLLNLIETSSEVANILAYGVENVHYQLDDNNQVVRLTNDYIVNNNYIGNAFLTHTMAGENPNKWENFKQQNLDSAKGEEQAITLGFAYYPQTFTDPDNKNIVYEEPDYIALITPIADKLYSKIITGEAGKVDYNTTIALVKDSVDNTLIEQIEAKYIEEVTATYHRQIEAKFNSEEFRSSIYNAAYNKALDDFVTTTFKNSVKRQLQAQLKEEFPGITTNELTIKINQIMTPDYLREQVVASVSEKEISVKTESKIFATINSRINDAKKELPNDTDYIADVAAAISSDACVKEKEEALGSDNYYLYQDAFAAVIYDKIKGLGEDLRKELSDAIKKEYNSFISETLKKFDYNDETKRSASLYNKALDNLANSDKIMKAIKNNVKSAVKEEMPDAKPDDVDVEVEKRLTPEYTRQKLLELALVTNAQIKAEYNNVLSDYVNDAVGFVKRTSSGTTEDDDEDPTENPPSDDEPEEDIPIDEDSDYFELLFVTRIKKQFYVFHPLPTGATG